MSRFSTPPLPLQHPLPEDARMGLLSLTKNAHDLLLIWCHLPEQARRSLHFHSALYPCIRKAMLAFFSTRARSDAECDDLVKEFAEASNP